MSRLAYAAFLVLTIAWLALALSVHPVPYGYFIAAAIIWWGLVVMTVATGYYVLQEAPGARVRGWLRRDLAINAVMLLALLFTILDGSGGFHRLSLPTAGWIAFAAALLHPLAVDLPHRRHHLRDPAGSPVPQYVPPACVWIDWTLAVLVLLGLAFV